MFEAYRYVAPLAWVPFAALWFGTGIGGPIMVIFAGAFAPCVVNAYRGAQLVERQLTEAARTLGAGGLRIMREVLLPARFPRSSRACASARGSPGNRLSVPS